MNKRSLYLCLGTLCILMMHSLVVAQTDTYLVVCSESDPENPYSEAAQILADYRSGDTLSFDASAPEALLPELIDHQPRYVVLVMRPEEIDINFVRKFLMMSTQLDADAFSDFSYGYITGADGQKAIDFVNTVIQAESDDIANFPLNVGGYSASSLNYVFTSPGDYLSYLNPPQYSNICMETSDTGTGLDFFLNNTAYMENNKLLDIGHNGDPHMLWLFEGGNTDPNPPVWDYDPDLIEDPDYARVGLSSYEISDLDLYPAVAFNGACHSGEPKRVMVEGDIAATFGDTDWETQFYTMSDTFSFALGILNTGITGYFAPCGANNANDQGEDVYNSFLYDEPLGDIHKRSIDAVVMGFLGNRPELKIYSQGEFFYGCDVLASGDFDPDDWSGACYMLGGKANRIYFGDPLFDPFANHHDPQLEIANCTLDSVDTGILNIDLDFNKPGSVYFPVWDKFHHGDTRIYYPVELPEYCDSITDVQVIANSSAYHDMIYATEHFDGKYILHIEVDIPDDMYSDIDFSMNLRAEYNPLTHTEHNAVQRPRSRIYPNPSEGMLTVLVSTGNAAHILIRDAVGRPVFSVSNVNEKRNNLDIRMLTPGLYFVEITASGFADTHKLLVR